MAVILLTNDDGVESKYFLNLVERLQRKGHHVLGYAPMEDQSGRSMALTLRKNILTARRDDLLDSMDLDPKNPIPSLFSIDGTPCDCVILAIDGFIAHNGDPYPDLCISGINIGPNMSIDLLHSGTVSGAREASLYGVPSIASSIAKHDPNIDPTDAVEITVDLAERLLEFIPSPPPNLRRPKKSSSAIIWDGEDSTIRQMFSNGDIFLNLNIPENCSRKVVAASVGARWYAGACNIIQDDQKTHLRVGSLSITDDRIDGVSSEVLRNGDSSLTSLAAWPQLHPLNVGDAALKQANIPSKSGLPRWII
mgnify:CR=1 FL=1